MTGRQWAVAACMMGAVGIGFAGGIVLASSPVREREIHAQIGSLKQCREDMAQITDWIWDERLAIMRLAQVEEITARQSLLRQSVTQVAAAGP